MLTMLGESTAAGEQYRSRMGTPIKVGGVDLESTEVNRDVGGDLGDLAVVPREKE